MSAWQPGQVGISAERRAENARAPRMPRAAGRHQAPGAHRRALARCQTTNDSWLDLIPRLRRRCHRKLSWRPMTGGVRPVSPAHLLAKYLAGGMHDARRHAYTSPLSLMTRRANYGFQRSHPQAGRRRRDHTPGRPAATAQPARRPAGQGPTRLTIRSYPAWAVVPRRRAHF